MRPIGEMKKLDLQLVLTDLRERAAVLREQKANQQSDNHEMEHATIISGAEKFFASMKR